MREVVPQLLIRSLNERRLSNATLAVFSYFASWFSGRPRVWGLPPVLTVEPTNHCNLRCPQCHTGSGKIGRPRTRLSFSHFQQLIDEFGDRLIYLILFNQGEPYLHPQFLDFVTYAKRKRIYVTTSTNGHFFADDDTVQRTVASGLDVLIISLDGADQETYERYRTGGDFTKVTEGIRRVAQEKNRQHRRAPKLFIQFLVMKHNEHQIEEVKRLAYDLGADRVLLKTAQVDSLNNAEFFLPKTERYRRYTIEHDRLKVKNNRRIPCRRLWLSSVINSDGCIVPCCFDKDSDYAFGDLGNADDFTHAWRSRAYQSFRTHILNHDDIEICENCTEGAKIFY